MASAGTRAYNGCLGGAHSGVQGQSPWSGDEAALKLKSFLLLDVNWKRQIALILLVLQTH